MNEDSNFSYQKLGANEIRLVHISEDAQESSPLSCQLVHVDFTTDPVFHALSYVWGDTSNPRSILLDGSIVNIEKNLHDALVQIRQNIPSFREILREETENVTQDVFLWIDALCIYTSRLGVCNRQKWRPLPPFLAVFNGRFLRAPEYRNFFPYPVIYVRLALISQHICCM